MSRKQRLDLHLLKKGLATSRQKAQQLIRAGRVRDKNGKVLDKPGQNVPEELDLLIEESPRFVSRGGEKLFEALGQFEVEVNGKVCLDGGVSTGGFTDCLLQHGAKRVYSIDVGYGQIAWNLRNDPRVVLRERTNLRTLGPEQLYGPTDQWPNLAVADLSFISLRLVLPAIKSLLVSEDSEALLLVKPQFEVGRERVGKGGVVRDPAAHVDALKTVIEAASYQKWEPKGIVPSPITGPAGNHEYILWLGSNQSGYLPNLEKLVLDTLA
ncbi:MAG: TlyA family RNA methyltransferase [Prochlorococcaceae cyanobacterium ETNP1_MAG_9]|jgi:23S rRNA (cytidine1920-2'-O)/16S rRNA (cytidine1409-2'-O)-methyltransferase|nr:TlyA family RNA methyltransferase [Prochlorococcaceae cyanobacterium ETNP1_MAG_9]